MNIFMNHEWPNYLTKINAVWQKIDTSKLNHELNSDEQPNGSEYGDLAILILLVICAILFWV